MLRFYFALVVLTIWMAGCGFSRAVSSESNITGPIAEATVLPEEPVEENKIATEVGEIEHNGYVLRKVLVTKTDDDSPAAEIFDAVIERNGRELLRFEGSYYPLGNEMRLGLTDKLAPGGAQFVVEEASNRFGALWVVDVSGTPGVIFDSGDYGGFREFIDYDDIDGDGLLEVDIARYYSCDFEGMSHSQTPMARILFGYDSGSRKMLPVDYKLADKAVARSAEYAEETRSGARKAEFRPLIEHVVDLALAGRETEAWRFFDENYSRYREAFKESPSTWNSNGTFCCQGANIPTSTARSLLRQCFDSDPVVKSIRQQLRAEL